MSKNGRRVKFDKARSRGVNLTKKIYQKQEHVSNYKAEASLHEKKWSEKDDKILTGM